MSQGSFSGTSLGQLGWLQPALQQALRPRALRGENAKETLSSSSLREFAPQFGKQDASPGDYSAVSHVP